MIKVVILHPTTCPTVVWMMLPAKAVPEDNTAESTPDTEHLTLLRRPNAHRGLDNSTTKRGRDASQEHPIAPHSDHPEHLQRMCAGIRQRGKITQVCAYELMDRGDHFSGVVLETDQPQVVNELCHRHGSSWRPSGCRYRQDQCPDAPVRSPARSCSGP